LSSTNAVMSGGYQTCVPESVDRGEIIRLARAYAAKTDAPDKLSARDGVGTALKARYPCE
jgi:Rap1a immunity proteins